MKHLLLTTIAAVVLVGVDIGHGAQSSVSKGETEKKQLEKTFYRKT